MKLQQLIVGATEFKSSVAKVINMGNLTAVME